MKEHSSDSIGFQILITRQQIETRVLDLGREIGKDYLNKDPLFICVLRGGLYFFSDLTKAIPYSVELDFIQAKSYVGTESTGKVLLTKDVDTSVEGRHIIVVEDVVDTGRTLKFLISHILSKNPKSLEIASLLYKEEENAVGYPIKYVGWNIGKEFVIGYGLDYDGKYRNLPGVYLYKE